MWCSRCHRIIPALAGNTRTYTNDQDMTWDHPRSRGEYRTPIAGLCRGLGSSPLSRGIPDYLRKPSVARRIIPALAGNTILIFVPDGQVTDHPRSRGEYTRKAAPLGASVGSSPLSRGILRHPVTLPRWPRIIPALAGNTGNRRGWSWVGPDHPRSRGEYLVYRVTEGPPRRIIPALAGNTWG